MWSGHNWSVVYSTNSIQPQYDWDLCAAGIATGTQITLGFDIEDNGNVWAYSPHGNRTITMNAICATPVPPIGQQLLVNGGFEQDLLGWQFLNPRSANPQDCPRFTGYPGPYEGTKFLASDRIGLPNNCISVYQDVSIAPQPGETYTATFYGRGVTPRHGAISLWALNATKEQSYSNYVLSPIWQCFSTTLTVKNSGHTSLRVELYMWDTDSGDYYFDAVTLEKGTQNKCVATPTPSNTATATLTASVTNTSTVTPTSSKTNTPTSTFTPSNTPTPSKTNTATATITPSNTPTSTNTPIVCGTETTPTVNYGANATVTVPASCKVRIFPFNVPSTSAGPTLLDIQSDFSSNWLYGLALKNASGNVIAQAHSSTVGARGIVQANLAAGSYTLEVTPLTPYQRELRVNLYTLYATIPFDSGSAWANSEIYSSDVSYARMWGWAVASDVYHLYISRMDGNLETTACMYRENGTQLKCGTTSNGFLDLVVSGDTFGSPNQFSYRFVTFQPQGGTVGTFKTVWSSNGHQAWPTATPSPTLTLVPSATLLPTFTPSNTPSLTSTASQTPSRTQTASNTPSMTFTPSNTPSASSTSSATFTPRNTLTTTPSSTFAPTLTGRPSMTVTATNTSTLTFTPTQTYVLPTVTATITSMPSLTLTSAFTPIPPLHIDTISIYRDGTFYMRNSNTTGFANITVAYNPATQPYPIVGDWTGSGIDTIGVYDQSNGQFMLRNSNTPGAPDETFGLGIANDQPLSGRWQASATHSGVGVFRPSNGLIYLKNELSTGFADYTMVLGTPGDVGVAGDWQGQGYDSPGVFRPNIVTFYLSDQVVNGSVFGDHAVTLGIPGDVPIVGDWIGQGHDGVGVFRVSNGLIYMKDSLTTGYADRDMVYGIANDIPVAGHWINSAAVSIPTAINLIVPNTPNAATATPSVARPTIRVTGQPNYDG